METKEKLEIIQNAIEAKKGFDIDTLFIGDKSSIADYFVICSANNKSHAESIMDEVDEKLAVQGILPRRVEGKATSKWIIMDYEDVIVHIFLNDEREYYNLERLWQNLETESEE
ncbi:ribosome silencing factor [Fenollaria sporofastidiosus]|uniref:ribosome silencing factor n=1 Tax=Fenollaria sporofastidiosus TaxID=2811778 RepID=UPI001C0045B0|nr:ribosome silencing factor [Fenollaria sporofastidiosus]